MSAVVAVPVKDLVNAKQRLIPFLSPSERGDLARAMLEDVLDALARAQVGPVLVVTRDPAVEALARRHGAGTLAGRPTAATRKPSPTPRGQPSPAGRGAS